MEDKYIFLCEEHKKGMDLYRYLLSDLFKLYNMEYYQIRKKNINNFFLKFLRRAHLSYKVSNFVNLPMKSIWFEFPDLDIKENCNYYIIMPLGVFFNCNISAIRRKYKKNKNVKFVFLLLDSLELKHKSNKLARKIYKDKLWDYVFSYDKHDAEKYNLIYLDEHYYSQPEIKDNKEIDKDAYFMGGLKPGRIKETIELFEYLKDKGVNVRFDIVNAIKSPFDYKKDGFNTIKQVKPYSYVLEEAEGTNCIIEFLQTGQECQSLRYFEAVCLNKKLLTNNKNVKELSFYNEKYMKIFDKLEDIDTEWIKKKEDVNYNYNGEFSPIHIIEKIKEIDKK